MNDSLVTQVTLNTNLFFEFVTQHKLVLVLLLAVFCVVWLAFNRRNDPYPYHSRVSLLTKSEQAFYRVLLEAVNGDALVFAKPRIADILAVNSMKDKKHWQRCFNRIAQKHVDFVLCDLQDQAFICAIELNDSSHERTDRRKRDVFVMKAFKRAKLPLIMHPTFNAYSAGEIRQKIAHLL